MNINSDPQKINDIASDMLSDIVKIHTKHLDDPELTPQDKAAIISILLGDMIESVTRVMGRVSGDMEGAQTFMATVLLDSIKLAAIRSPFSTSGATIN